MGRSSDSGGGGQSPLSSLTVVDGGLTVPRRALDRFAVMPASGVRHVVCIGDSVSQGTAVFVGSTGGYFDSWIDRFARALGQAMGPLVGAGWQGLWRSGNALGYANTATEWGFAGTWVQLIAGAGNLTPYRAGLLGSGGATSIATWTPRAAQAARVVADAVTQANVTAVAAGSDGVNITSFAGAGVLSVASTAGFPAAGVVRVKSAFASKFLGFVSYTAIAGNTFTGCQVLANSPGFVMHTGDVVDNVTIVTSATAAFAATDVGQGIYGANIPRNAHVSQRVNATTIAISMPALGASAAGVLGLSGRAATPIAQIDVYYQDQAGTGQISTSVDNGATWQNGPVNTNPATPVLKKFSVVTANPANFQIRCADAAAVAHNMILAGIVVYSVAAPTSGVVVHNLCRDGAVVDAGGNGSNNGFLQGSGLRLLDNAGRVDASLQPSLVIVLSSNDVGINPNDFTGWTNNLSTILATVGGYADMVVLNCFEQIRTETSAQQAAYRAATKAWCAANNVACLDIYDALGAQGDVGVAACDADGLMNEETVPGVLLLHPSLELHADIAGHIMRAFSMMAI